MSWVLRRMCRLGVEGGKCWERRVRMYRPAREESVLDGSRERSDTLAAAEPSCQLIYVIRPDIRMTRRLRQKLRGRLPTLTSSNGALPTQTTAPLAPPASKLVNATSLAEFSLNMPSPKLIQFGSPLALPLPLAPPSTSLFPAASARAAAGSEFKIRLLEV